ncbi:MAG: T9SS type A sorting domain-containing protein [Bacteroidota bacterium]
MKKLLFSFTLLFIPLLCFSQTNTPDVIISAGSDFQRNGYAHIAWTLGDFQTATYSKNGLTLTQGFLQSNFNITGIYQFEEISEISIKVFPNPVKDILNIQIQSKQNLEIRWELINQSGRVIKTSNSFNNSNNYQINFSSFENGVYFIRTFNKAGSYIKIFKVVYLN